MIKQKIKLRVRLHAAIPKSPSGDGSGATEDSLVIDSLRNVYAISDGATLSFDSGRWSRLIAKYYVAANRPITDWIWDAKKEFDSRTSTGPEGGWFKTGATRNVDSSKSKWGGWKRRADSIGVGNASADWFSPDAELRISTPQPDHERSVQDWYEPALRGRGAAATLLGVRLRPGQQKCEIFAIGDSLAVLVDGEHVLDTFPYSDPTQFYQHPQLLSSELSRNNKIFQPGYLKSASRVWSFGALSAPGVLLMTDALGQWLLTDPVRRVRTLLSLRTRQSFCALVNSERASKRLKDDDSTLLVLAESPSP